MEKNPHHLIMGELTDFLTGEILADTHDERYRQKLARLLVKLGYAKADIEKNRGVIIRAGGRRASLKVDFLVYKNGAAVMMIKYAPGSLVTRRLSNLALSRIIFDYQIPVVVTTNGEDAEVICGTTGKVRARDCLPFRGQTMSGWLPCPGCLRLFPPGGGPGRKDLLCLLD